MLTFTPAKSGSDIIISFDNGQIVTHVGYLKVFFGKYLYKGCGTLSQEYLEIILAEMQRLNSVGKTTL